jgi:hypothetical protein
MNAAMATTTAINHGFAFGLHGGVDEERFVLLLEESSAVD